MRIIVCIKQIRHTFARTGLNPETFYLTEEDAIFRLNPYDETAFELALTLKKSTPAIEIVILTLGPLIAESGLRRCFALGGDRLVQIDTPEAASLDPWQKAAMLARATRELKGDLVFCGKESLDRRNGQTPAFLARLLGLPFVSGISTVDLSADGREARVTRKGGRGSRQIWQSPLPAVFSVAGIVDKPRVPSLRGRRQADQYAVQTLYYGTASEAPRTRSLKIYAPKPRTKPVEAPPSDLSYYDRIESLLSGSRVQKDSRILAAGPADQVDGILQFLEENGFLS